MTAIDPAALEAAKRRVQGEGTDVLMSDTDLAIARALLEAEKEIEILLREGNCTMFHNEPDWKPCIERPGDLICYLHSNRERIAAIYRAEKAEAELAALRNHVAEQEEGWADTLHNLTDLRAKVAAAVEEIRKSPDVKASAAHPRGAVLDILARHGLTGLRMDDQKVNR